MSITGGTVQRGGIGGLELDQRPADVLALGSLLAYGSVGLNAAARVYAEAGLRAVTLPTCVLSNLPHYDRLAHVDTGPQWLADALRNLTQLGALGGVRAVAVGYLGRADQAEQIADWYLSLPPDRRAAMPMIVDPSFGDADVGFYADPAVADSVRTHLAPLAIGLTPNSFELGFLTDGTSTLDPTSSGLTRAATTLLGGHTGWVVVTGLHAPGSPGSHGSLGPGSRNSTVSNLVATPTQTVTLTRPRLPGEPKGTGDVFTASLVTRLLGGATILVAAQDAAVQVEQTLTGLHGARGVA